MTGQTVHRLSGPDAVNVTQATGDPTESHYEPVEIASALTFTVGLIQVLILNQNGNLLISSANQIVCKYFRL